jgi:UDP-N-acetylmuramate--alanine ligase
MSAADVAAWSDPVPSLEELGAVHFVGIGGAGMSGIARILLARGVRVSGSDRRDTPTLLALRALGARVAVGHNPENLGDADTLVVSTAIRADNPELVAARERGLLVLPRAVALAAEHRGRRNAREDLDHLDAHRRRPGLRRRPVLRHRR